MGSPTPGHASRPQGKKQIFIFPGPSFAELGHKPLKSSKQAKAPNPDFIGLLTDDIRDLSEQHTPYLLQAGIALTTVDFDTALGKARASYSVESIGAPKIPNVSWNDVGGLAHKMLGCGYQAVIFILSGYTAPVRINMTPDAISKNGVNAKSAVVPRRKALRRASREPRGPITIGQNKV
ncbi:hypothetical protein BDZ94DRAFT_1367625 [Collybia nuda]|uniref:Uncharacterized protein n=1 Tax=Collybia nuda TaxID=64659 RepID=A0A9P6CAW1_9AGAR|nr:hypothetical protein BDZ94DRAFT_1367625 [Collybia nuda]